MSSILHNTAALSALQALNMTQQALGIVQNQVSTGLAVATAADNSSYWSIATQLNNDSGIVTAANTSLSQGQSVLATASSAINSVITTLNSMATALTQAENPGANISNINTSLASLGAQLSDAVTGASFNGLNVLNGTQTAMTFVSGFNANAQGGSVNTISFAAQALIGGTTTNPQALYSPVTSVSTAGLATLKGTLASSNTPLNYAAAAVGKNQVYEGTASGNDTLTMVSVDSTGNRTTTVYTGTGGTQTGDLQADLASQITGMTVQTTYTPASVGSTTASTITSNSMITDLLASTAHAAAPVSGTDQVILSSSSQTGRMIVNSVDASGDVTSTTYTALNASGGTMTGAAWGSLSGVKSIAVSTTYTPASAAAATSTTNSTLTDPTQMGSIQALESANSGATTAAAVSITSPTAIYGQNSYYYNSANQAFTVQSAAANGSITNTTYTALDKNGNSIATGATLSSFNGATSYAVTTTTIATSPTSNPSLLTQSGTDLTQLGESSTTGTTITASNSSTVLSAVNSALASVTNYAATIGATQDRMTAASTFNTALNTNYASGVSGLVDADMNTASTRLQALQTQEQLGIQSLSIANQNAQLILKLFS